MGQRKKKVRRSVWTLVIGLAVLAALAAACILGIRWMSEQERPAPAAQPPEATTAPPATQAPTEAAISPEASASPELAEPVEAASGELFRKQAASGGAALEGVVLAQMQLDQGDQGLSALLSFDLESEEGTRSPAASLPPYRVLTAQSPSRVWVELSGLSGWEGGSSPDWLDLSLLAGSYKSAPAEGDGVTVALQFNQPVTVSVEEKGGVLALNIRPEPDGAAQAPAYRVVMDAFQAYQEGMLPPEISLMPAVCEDGGSIVLLSEPFEREEEAQQELSRLEAALPDYLFELQQLTGDQPPRLPLEDREAIENQKVVQPAEGVQVTARLWAANARFMDWLKVGERAVFVRPSPIQEVDGQELSQLWCYQIAGRGLLLSDLEFVAVDEVRASQSGLNVAVAENMAEERTLFDLALDGSASRYLGDYLGSHTAGWSWAEDGMLYALAGEDQLMLMAYDPEASDDLCARLVDDTVSDSGTLEIAGKALFLSDGSSQIYRYELDTGESEAFAPGADFALSPAGDQMALIGYDAAGTYDSYAQLSLMDLTTREQKPLIEGKPLGGVCWSSDGARLYYVTYDSPDSEHFTMSLNEYTLATGATRLIGATATDLIYPGSQPDELIAVCNSDGVNGDGTASTYCLTIK